MSFLITPDISKTPETLPSHPYKFPLDPFNNMQSLQSLKMKTYLYAQKQVRVKLL